MTARRARPGVRGCRLHVVRPSGREREIDLGDEPVTVGRSQGNTLALAETLVSRHHARIDPCDGGYRITDRGSKNGTLVNDVAVREPTRLRDGDRILIGETAILFRAVLAGEDAAATPEPALTAAPAPRDETVDLTGDPDTAVPAPAGPAPVGGPAAPVVALPEPGGLAALARFSSMLTAVDADADAFDGIAFHLMSLVGCDRATVVLVEQGPWPRAQYSRSASPDDEGHGPDESVIHAALTTDRPVCIRVPRARAVLGTTLGVRSHLLSVPLSSRGKRLGLVVFERDPDLPPFEDAELQVATIAAGHLTTFVRALRRT